MKTEQGKIIRLRDYRKPDYSVESVELTFRLYREATQVIARLKVARNEETIAGTPLQFDGSDLLLTGLKINGKPVGKDCHTVTSSALIIDKPPAASRFTLEVETQINPQANTRLMGLYRSGGNYCTQCEADGFRRITFFPDRPDVLAVFTTRIEADKSEAPVLLGNGNPIESGPLGNDRHYAVWHDPHPKPCYLFALVGGDLEAIHEDYVTASGKPVRLSIHTEKGKSKRAHYAMDALVRSMRWDEQVFGREYDLEVFNIVAVSDFNMGAMENKGLNIFNDKYVLADPQTATDADHAGIERVIAHEYFHNWTGNRITCRDWFQLCLKEGLTVYRDQEFTADQRSRAVQRIAEVRTLKAHQFAEDAGPLAHPVRPAQYREINNFYTTTVYEKGAELVRMIAAMLGRAVFRKGMDLYFRRHDGEAATIEDFLKCFEDAGNTDLSQFALWYAQAGTPSLPVSASYDKAAKSFAIEIEQNLSATPGQSRKRLMHIPVRIGLISAGKSEMTPEKVTGIDHRGDLFHITRRQHKIVFHGIDERPVVSLNRDFTAPVNVDFAQSDADLALLALMDSDPFNRWQAFQNLAMRSIIATVHSIHRGKAPAAMHQLSEIAAEILTNDKLEPAYRALMVTLPGEIEIAQTIGSNVDPDAISSAWHFTMAQIGAASEPLRPMIAQKIRPQAVYNPTAEEAGKRSLANQMLNLGVLADSANAKAESAAQFDNANNMNDRAAALVRIVHLHGNRSQAAKAIDEFARLFANDPLVMDKWFNVQATAPGGKTIETVRKLMNHPGFSLKNPNRVRSLIGAFATANPTGFHAVSGKGYDLVCDVIAELDGINPQVAARLLTGFRSWRSLEEVRRKLARERLEALGKKNNLSGDSADILERMLKA